MFCATNLEIFGNRCSSQRNDAVGNCANIPGIPGILLEKLCFNRLVSFSRYLWLPLFFLLWVQPWDSVGYSPHNYRKLCWKCISPHNWNCDPPSSHACWCDFSHHCWSTTTRRGTFNCGPQPEHAAVIAEHLDQTFLRVPRRGRCWLMIFADSCWLNGDLTMTNRDLKHQIWGFVIGKCW